MNETRGPYRGFMRQWAGEPFRAALGADDAHPVSQHLRTCRPLAHGVPLVETASFVFSGTSPSEWDQGFESPSLLHGVCLTGAFRGAGIKARRSRGWILGISPRMTY